MDQQIRLLIYKKKYIYDDVKVSSNFIHPYKKDTINHLNNFQTSSDDIEQEKIFYPLILRKKGFNAYLVSTYTYIIARSDTYRKSAVDVLIHFIKSKAINIKNTNTVILIRLKTPRYQFLDYRWSERLTQMVMERQEIDHAMSWLSTLGGAFSALGDKYNHHAKVAGKISVHQFKLAMRLGDPQLVARCKLYAALSLLQQNYLKVTKYAIKDIYAFAINDKDIRLQRMCQGVWAKLKYYYSQRNQRIKQENKFKM